MKLCFLDLETTGLDPQKAEPWEIGLILRGGFPDLSDGGDREYLWQLWPRNLETAEPMALQVSRFTERFALTGYSRAAVAGHVYNGVADSPVEPLRTDWDPDAQSWISKNWRRTDQPQLASDLFGLLNGAVICGSNVGAYDLPIIRRLLAHHGFPATWHYHPVDVPDLVVGHLRGMDAGLADQGVRDRSTPEGKKAWLEALTPPYRSTEVYQAIQVEAEEGGRHTALGDARRDRAAYDKVMKWADG